MSTKSSLPRRATSSWPTYEVRERDFETFHALPHLIGRPVRRPFPPHAPARRTLERLLEPAARLRDDPGGAVRFFTVRRNDTPVGRVAVFADIPAGGERPRVGRFGLLDGRPDPRALGFLLEVATDWLATRGCQTVVGNAVPGRPARPVDPALHSILRAMGFQPGPGASEFACALRDEAVSPVREPDGVAWRPLARAPWRGLRGVLAGEEVAVVECVALPETSRWRPRRGAPARVACRRFEVREGYRARGLGRGLAHSFMDVLRGAGVREFHVGPVLDMHVPARRILRRLGAERGSRVELVHMALQ